MVFDSANSVVLITFFGSNSSTLIDVAFTEKKLRYLSGLALIVVLIRNPDRKGAMNMEEEEWCEDISELPDFPFELWRYKVDLNFDNGQIVLYIGLD